MTKGTEPKPAVITLAPGLEQPELTFDSGETFEEWFEREKENWNWLAETTLPSPIRNHIANTQKYLQEINSKLSQWKTAADEDKPRFIKELTKHLTRWEQSSQVLTSEDPRAQFIFELAADDPEIAAYTLLAFVAPQRLPGDAPSTKGVVHAIVFSSGLGADNVAVEKNALTELHQLFSQRLRDGTESLARISFDRKKLNAEAERGKRILKKYVQRVRRHTGAERQRFENEIRTIAATYDEKLALQAPVQYWKDKESWHRTRFFWYTVAFLFLLVVTIALLWLELDHWLLNELRQTGEDNRVYWPFIVLIGSAAFLFWPLRIVARLLISNAHLSIDAAERVAMANTYLALMRSEESLPDRDRKLILDALFRSSSTGIVKDDHAPPSSFDIVSRIMSGKSH